MGLHFNTTQISCVPRGEGAFGFVFSEQFKRGVLPPPVQKSLECLVVRTRVYLEECTREESTHSTQSSVNDLVRALPRA
jgi:hypothetical protein